MGNPTDMPLAVQLSMPAETQATLRQYEGTRHVAEAYEIDSPEMAVEANNELRSIKASLKRLEELRKGFVAPAMQIVENARALFNPAIAGLTEGEKILKAKLLAWQQAEDRRIEEENRRIEEAARKARQEAEAKAAAERARADQQAAEANRKAQEAEEARRKAEAEGNARAAAAAAAEAAKQAERAAAAVENGEARAQVVQLQAAAAAPVATAAPVKLAGLSYRDNWIAILAVNTTETQAIQKIAAALADRPELVALLKLDMSAATKMAKALKENFRVPGLAAENQKQVASRK